MKERFISAAWTVVIGLLGAGVLSLIAAPPRGEPVKLLPPPTPMAIVVHVVGAVEKPGVYELRQNSRIRDAIEAAGGFLADANPDGLNLAAPLVDGAQVRVAVDPSIDITLGKNPVQPDGQDLASPTPDVPGSQVVEPDAADERININTALQRELETLPGIGPTISLRIIEYREQNGPYTIIDDIMNVSGIGPAKFEGIMELITTDG